MRVAVVGSGLSAIAAIKTLISRGVKPIVLDIGKNLDRDRAAIVSRMSQTAPENWREADKNLIASNPTLHGKSSVPKKLAFGSDYFYGKQSNSSFLEGAVDSPPFSTAKGGFSAGWGATVLPAADIDLADWPIKNRELKKYYQQILNDLPLSAKQDSLADHFPLFADHHVPLELTTGNQTLLKDMENANIASAEHITFGQSRLLVRAVDEGVASGCKKCGQCMSGCVYDCIYKSSRDIDRFCRDGAIEYIADVTVKTLHEKGDNVAVQLQTIAGNNISMNFDRVILAAGAVNSTRIVLESKQLYNHEVILKSTVGFVLPMLRFKRHSLDWPNANTQPGIFFEYKIKSLSDHWVHTQMSTPNELVISKIDYDVNTKGIVSATKKRLLEHMIVAHVNMHSDHANGYTAKLIKSSKGAATTMSFKRQNNEGVKRAVKKAEWALLKLGSRFGCYSVLPVSQNSIATGSYHLGGSLPMRLNPTKETDTNTLGSPKGWHRIHVVDSSVFPSIPGTTIGLLAMANAARITSEIELE